MKKIVFVIVFLSLAFDSLALAAERLAVLPLSGIGIEASTQQTAYLLLQSELRQLDKYELVPQSAVVDSLGAQSCSEQVCAVELGKKTGADKVVYGSLNRLGEKIIVQYNLVEVGTGKSLLSDDISATQVEELDQVMKRVAMSIVQQVPANKTVEVGLVTEQESLEPNSRKANSSWGVGFGYLYPQKGYDNKSSIFVWDFRSFYETRNVAVDAVLGIREGFAVNIGFDYLFSRRDFSPFLGAGIGFHNVSHEGFYQDGFQVTKSSDGFEITAKAGFLAFRTYDFRVITNVEYTIALNEYDDHAIIFTIGVMRAGKRVFGIF